MQYFYSDTGSSGAYDPGLIARLNPNTQYKKHLENWFFLKFIMMNSDDWREKAQASKELTICDRKLKFWQHRPTFNDDTMRADVIELKKKWKMK